MGNIFDNPNYRQIDIEGHTRTWSGGHFKFISFFAIREGTRIFRESYDTYIIEKFNSALNARHKYITVNIASAAFTEVTLLP